MEKKRDRPIYLEEVEVTPEMIEAGANEMVGYSIETGSIEEYLPAVYRAMLAARPKRG